MWDAAEGAGFAPDSLKILKTLAAAGSHPQVLLFSATFSDTVRSLAERLVGPSANRVLLPRETLSLDVIKQFRVDCPTQQAKEAVLRDMIFPAAERLGQSIVFVRTRARCAALHSALEKAGHRCTSIRGDLTHAERDAVISEFRGGRTKILIATDVLSRGFDHAAVTLVVNYDPPVTLAGAPAYETYMHRSACPARRSPPGFRLFVPFFFSRCRAPPPPPPFPFFLCISWPVRPVRPQGGGVQPCVRG